MGMAAGVSNVATGAAGTANTMNLLKNLEALQLISYHALIPLKLPEHAQNYLEGLSFFVDF